jgi:S1-C subfamily serine protease
MKLTFRSADGTERATEVTSGRVVIGREEDADVVLDDDETSRQHAVIETRSDGTTLITDLGSRNGTFVDGRRIAGPTELRGDETIRIGTTEVRLSGLARGGETVLSSRERGATVPGAGAGTAERTSRERTLLIIAAVAAAIAVLAVAGGILAATNVIGGDDTSAVADTGTDTGDNNPIPEIITKARPSVANIITHPTRIRGEVVVEEGGGSGWVLDAAEGLIVTASHVVQEASRFTVEIGDTRSRAVLHAAAPCEDLAVLRLREYKNLKEMPLGSQDDLEQGEPVVALGFPLNTSLQDRLVATSGIVSQVKTPWREPSGPDFPIFKNVVQTDAAINPGNSGGPLVNRDGELVGVNVATVTGSQNENYAVGVDRVKQIVEDLKTGDSRGWNGMNFKFGLRGFPGMANLGAVPGTQAATEGFDEYELLGVYATHVNGKPLKNMRQYCAVAGEWTAGDVGEFRFVDKFVTPQNVFRRKIAFE